MIANLMIKVSNAEEYSLNIPLDLTVEEFKGFTASKIGICPSQQKVIYRGKLLENEKSLSAYGLKEQSTIHISCLADSPQYPDSPTFGKELSSQQAAIVDRISPLPHAKVLLKRETYFSELTTPLKTYNGGALGVQFWLHPEQGILEVALGDELNSLYFRVDAVCELAKKEYAEEQNLKKWRKDSVAANIALEDAQSLERHLAVGYILQRVDVLAESGSPPSSPLTTHALSFLPRCGDDTSNTPLVCEAEFIHSNAAILKRADLSTYRQAIDFSRKKIETLLETLSAILPPVANAPTVTPPTLKGNRCLPPHLTAIESDVQQRGEVLCATSLLRLGFRRKYLSHLKRFVLAVKEASRDEILGRHKTFRAAMNSTHRRGLYGGLIMSDIEEVDSQSPIEELRRKYRAQYSDRRNLAENTSSQRGQINKVTKV